ncbi:EmrB/QacA subfamily drug resistance transporter [Streptosporangium becharense]|uniref:EmrB/QacA subfamily drug resistance transporter n=1 Tax=Streptosporangium becharense TaxID=1816182 RepID=A0A7W9MGJ6_9ACTN|nr:MFS transporter [Streptosporangium becharense]MBB2909596.1 EmrB/QacA subfamily drug resistance transporter [Streptosporangium becharense]MBB5819448.1 EmrB/QacA subfamily drug resistance transporter [Streptosporangium becharense]
MTPSSHDGRWDARLWSILAVLCAVIFLDALDVSMVGVALPSIQADLGLSTSSLQWVVSGYVLGYGGLLLLGGRTADLLGRRRVFLAALAVFAVASLLGGLVDDGTLLIAARFVKGVSAAFTAPAALSIITTTFAEGPARNRALSVFTASGASGFSLGLVISGLLTELGWRWTFLMPVPVAVIALVAALRVLPRPADRDRAEGGYDLVGAVTVTGSMLLLVFAVVEAPEAGWSSLRTIASLAGAAALLVAFVLVERRVKHPLVRLGILRSGPIVRANLGLVILFGSYVGFQFVAMQYFQNLLHWSALETALAFLPAGLLVAVTSTRMGDLADRFGTARLIVIGSAALAAGYAFFLRIDGDPSLATLVIPGMVLLGVAFALSFPSLNIQATNGVADDEQGLASGLLNTSGQVGGAVVLAVVTAVLTSGADADPIAGFRAAVAVSGILALVGLVIALTGLRGRRPEAVAAEDGKVLEPA